MLKRNEDNHWPPQEPQELSENLGRFHSSPPSSGLAPGKVIKQEHLASTSCSSLGITLCSLMPMEFYSQKSLRVHVYPEGRILSIRWPLSHSADTTSHGVSLFRGVAYFKQSGYALKERVETLEEKETQIKSWVWNCTPLSLDPTA